LPLLGETGTACPFDLRATTGFAVRPALLPDLAPPERLLAAGDFTVRGLLDLALEARTALPRGAARFGVVRLALALRAGAERPVGFALRRLAFDEALLD
jgi:hypothetical protein